MSNGQEGKDLNEMISEVMQQVFTQISALREAMKTAVFFFRNGQEKEGNDNFIPCIEGLKLLLNSLDIVEVYYKPNLREEDKGVFEKIKKESSMKFEEVFQAQKNEDWLVLADYLEFEISPFLDQINSMLLSWSSIKK